MKRHELKKVTDEMLCVHLMGVLGCRNHQVSVEFFDMLSELLVRKPSLYEELDSVLHRDGAHIKVNLFTVANLRCHDKYLVDDAIILYTNCAQDSIRPRLLEWFEELAESY